jgi:rhamnosyltransferase subunit B
VQPRRYLFVPIGSHGDVHPLVGLAVAMQARGHRVSVCTNGYFQELITKNGLAFRELGTAEEYLTITNNPAVWDKKQGPMVVLQSLVQRLLRTAYELLLQEWQQEPFILVASPLCFAARILHETHHVPLISTHLQPLVLRSGYEVPGLPAPIPSWAPAWWIRAIYWLADKALIDRTLAPTLNGFRAELGLPPVSRIMNGWWNSPQRVVGLWPSWYAKPQPDWPPQVRLAGFPLYDERAVHELPLALVDFLANGDAPIVFTPGSAMRQGQAFFTEAIAACARLQKRGVLLTRFAENIPANLPANILYVPFAPFSLLLPHCAALVHHGGIGTLAQALAAGIPQLLMPMSHDQPDNLLRLQRLGVGVGIAPEQFKAPLLAEKLAQLLQDQALLQRCQALQKRQQADTPLATACALLEEAL